jgi:hypothetical protein
MHTCKAAVIKDPSAVHDLSGCLRLEAASGGIRKGNKGTGYIVWHDENLFSDLFFKLHFPGEKIKFSTKENYIKYKNVFKNILFRL